MGGKLTVTRNESQSMTLCIIFMLMCTTRQLFLTRGGKHKPSLYYVFTACHNRKTQTGSVFLCAYTHNKAVLIPVALEGELHINISKNSECPKKEERQTLVRDFGSDCVKAMARQLELRL